MVFAFGLAKGQFRRGIVVPYRSRIPIAEAVCLWKPRHVTLLSPAPPDTLGRK